MDPKYFKLNKGDSDEYIDVENSVTTDLSVSGSNDNLSDVVPDSENEYTEENISVAIHMEHFLEGDKFKRITSIETIPVGNFQMKDYSHKTLESNME